MKVCTSNHTDRDEESNGFLAHHIRNRSSQIFIAACAVRASHKWCLTGTPVHNSLDDYGALLSFVGVPEFRDKSVFDRWITKPIQQKKREGFDRLRKLVQATCLRRTKESIGNVLCLPPRNERTEYVQLHERDQELYDLFKTTAAELASGTKSFDVPESTLESSPDCSVLSLLNFLRLICDHGQALLPDTALRMLRARSRAMPIREEFSGDGNGNGAYKHSAKLCALIANLLARTPTVDAKGQLVPVKRYGNEGDLVLMTTDE